MTKIIICDWCGFINNEDVVEDYYSNYHCLCCGVDDVETAES
ncbi:hypothetical protein [Bacillus sp. V3B]|nr:hypothetical protein [Bacillus sp. V3B]